MPRFVGGETKVVRAEWWGPKEWARIRRFGYGDRQALAAVYVRVEKDEATGETRRVVDVQAALERMNLAILERGLEAWTDEEGNEIPVTAEAVAELRERDAEFLLAEIQALNPRRERSAEAQRNFRGGGGGGAATGERDAGGDDGGADLPGDGVELAGVDGDAGRGGG